MRRKPYYWRITCDTGNYTLDDVLGGIAVANPVIIIIKRPLNMGEMPLSFSRFLPQFVSVTPWQLVDGFTLFYMKQPPSPSNTCSVNINTCANENQITQLDVETWHTLVPQKLYLLPSRRLTASYFTKD